MTASRQSYCVSIVFSFKTIQVLFMWLGIMCVDSCIMCLGCIVCVDSVSSIVL